MAGASVGVVAGLVLLIVVVLLIVLLAFSYYKKKIVYAIPPEDYSYKDKRCIIN